MNRKVIGYLCGTFDLFHVGHLNILKRAKENCDYLIVGVHKDGKWKGKETIIPFEDRMAIVASIRYVDKVKEVVGDEIEAWKIHKLNKLFVGSDYLGTDLFNNYEAFF